MSGEDILKVNKTLELFVQDIKNSNLSNLDNIKANVQLDHKITKEFEEKMKKYSQNPKGGTVTIWE